MIKDKRGKAIRDYPGTACYESYGTGGICETVSNAFFESPRGSQTDFEMRRSEPTKKRRGGQNVSYKT